MIGAVILQLVLIFLNAFFASAEMAVVTVSETKLEKLAEEGSKKAKRLLKLKGNPSKFLSTIQVAITLAGFMGSAYAADNFADPLTAWIVGLGAKIPEATLNTICVFAITVVLSYFSIVLGELVPKRIALKHAEKISLGLSGLLVFVSGVFAPCVWILTKSTNAILRLLGINPNEEEDAASEDELRMMLQDSSERGAIDSLENEMIQNIFDFDDTSVSEICTHRRDVTFLYAEDSIDEWRQTLTETRYNYYPICGKDADDIIGVLNFKKFFRTECESVEEAIKNAAEKPYFVPENMKADILFENMKKARSYFAVAIDEYGGTSGVVTVHDLLELLVGELVDKDEIPVEEIRKTGENQWHIFGAADLEEVAKELDLDIDTEECETFGGYIFSLLGSMPDDGATPELETEELYIRVELVEDHRIERAVVTRKP
ncbi:MAG: HlyC/CorC family transporter, partial [Clostridia bacterium]|nr:HlyC/CorC family transporter [Clostridia bacterium]